MRQVLFEIPGVGLKIFGYGFMLMVAFLVGISLATRRARAEGIKSDHIWDVAMPIFIAALIGARLLSRIMEPEPGDFWTQVFSFFEIWRGGMILYGGVAGALLGYLWAYYRTVKPNGLSTLRIADIVAPALALGLFFGRIGCFLNGCCWGDVADPAAAAWVQQLGPAAAFPGQSSPHRELVREGVQTMFGFAFGERDDGRTIAAVEHESEAWRVGLRPGDVVQSFEEQQGMLLVTIRRDGETKTVAFEPPRTIPLIPTQLMSALDGVVLFILLTAFYPFRRRAGEVIALLTLIYPINRFFIEMLRMDNPPQWFGLTLSQNISIGLFLFGVGLWFYVRWRNVSVKPEPAIILTPSQPMGMGYPA